MSDLSRGAGSQTRTFLSAGLWPRRREAATASDRLAALTVLNRAWRRQRRERAFEPWVAPEGNPVPRVEWPNACVSIGSKSSLRTPVTPMTFPHQSLKRIRIWISKRFRCVEVHDALARRSQRSCSGEAMASTIRFFASAPLKWLR